MDGLLDKLIQIKKAEDSFYEFFKQAWPVMEYGKPFQDGWHIHALCEHLEAVYHREIRNLLINVPPRTSKTSIVSVAFPAWVWIHNPSEEFLCCSYSASVSLISSINCRQLIESDWYQKNWGHLFQIIKDQNTKSRFVTDKRGNRTATSVGGAVTGLNASISLMDDPNNVLEGESDAIRQTTNRFWSTSWSNRLNNPSRDARVLMQQRNNMMDVSGYVMATEDSSEWVKLILPMEYESSRKCITVPLKSTDGKVWEDPREVEGEILSPDRFPTNVIDRYKKQQGSYGYAGQYQQRPSPEEGGIIKKSYFQHWKEKMLPDIEFVLQSWDTALEKNDKNSFSACTTWGIFRDMWDVPNVILLGVWRGKVEFPELRKAAKNIYNDWRDHGDGSINDNKHRPDLVLIEAKASGTPLVHEFQRAGIPVTRFNPTKYGDKMQRAHLMTPIMECGRVWLPCIPNTTKFQPYAEEFLQCCLLFPNKMVDDVVDTASQAILRLKASGWVKHMDDEDFETTPRRVRATLY